jgi:hypothetical protein
MRIPLALTSIALVALSGAVNAAPRPACEQVSPSVEEAVRPLLANLAQPQPEATQLSAEVRACLSSRNICSVVYSARSRESALVEGDSTTDLPAQGQSSAIVFLVRSVPRVRNDSNRYCLISERRLAASPVQQWDVYGWVIAPNASQALPLQKQTLSSQAVPEPSSLRALAAALWFFAERMSGQPAP